MGNKGNFHHNRKVLETGFGELILIRRPKQEIDLDDYGACSSCLGFYATSDLYKHQKYHCVGCKEGANSSADAIYASNVLIGKNSASKQPSTLEEQVFPSMRGDNVTLIAKHDPLIKELGKSWLIRTKDMDITKRNNYVSQKMRETARLLQKLREICPGKFAISDFITPDMFDCVIQAVNDLCGLESSESTPALALKLGYNLKRIAQLKKALAIRAWDNEKEKEAERYLELHNSEWSEKISAGSLNVLYNRKFNKKDKLPLSGDLQLMNAYLEEELREIPKQITVENFRRLQMLCLARLGTFNRRRPGEMEQMT